MKYYLIVGEASGDLHASRLMECLKQEDPEAEFRFFGGDKMLEAAIGSEEANNLIDSSLDQSSMSDSSDAESNSAADGPRVRHFKELAYMGFVPVLMHLPTILGNMRMCKRDIVEWAPDVVILVDYPGFNLDIAKFVKAKTQIPVYYYISPKIWAWKEWRIKAIKRDVSQLFSILPFEVEFFEQRHNYPIHYVGNPTAEEIASFRQNYTESYEEFCHRNGLNPKRRIIALLAGSRKQEIKDNLPAMIKASRGLTAATTEYQLVVAGAPAIDDEYYRPFLADTGVKKVDNETYELLAHSTVALVTSGTATLETALLNVPQVVCYKTPLPHLIRWAFNHIIACRFISLVNLVADREVVAELMADRFSIANIKAELGKILPGGIGRQAMLDGYQEVARRLGTEVAPENAAKQMIALLRK